jgi:hypothetical protein
MTASSLSLGHAGARPTGAGIVARIARAAATVWLLDGLYVVVVFAGILHATTGQRIFQGIARALLGPSAFNGGATTTAIGVFMHFLVALSWSCVWAAIYESSAVIRRGVTSVGRALAVAVAYGVFVWLSMRYLVLPLTQNPPAGPIMARGTLLVLLAHVTVIGPPIVLLERRSV